MNIYSWMEQTERKTVCKYLTEIGEISIEDWIIDSNYFKNDTSEIIKSGYRVWSKPLVSIIKKNEFVSKIVAILAKWMIEDIKYRKGVTTRLHLKGFVCRRLLFNPVSWCLGKLKLLGAYVSGKSKQCFAVNNRS